MFTMMNEARQGVGIQGLGVAERSYQQALPYAKERLQGTRRDGSRFLVTTGCLGNFNFDNIFYRCINGRVVHIDNLVAFLAVGFLDSVLDSLDRFLLGQDAGNKEEGGLHNHVDAGTKTNRFSKFDGINNVEFGLLGNELFLYFGRQLFPHLGFLKGGGQQEGASIFKVGEHVIFVQEGEVMTGNKVCLINKVRCHNLILTEAKMACGKRNSPGRCYRSLYR